MVERRSGVVPLIVLETGKDALFEGFHAVIGEGLDTVSVGDGYVVA
ncbi:Uncharacterised protein [Chlamydia trachomatis]|nr:Uncharacterised protein [Chlamydia trachomatis]